MFWLTRNRSLTFSGRSLVLKSKIHKPLVWDTHNVTITFAKHNDEPRLIKIHSATADKSKEVQFRR